jgi:hypothetical protein
MYNNNLHKTLNTQSLQKRIPCNNIFTLDPDDPNYISRNQRLAGPPNPKTLIPPVIVPRPADLDHWRANNLINHSHINTETQWDKYLSGYEISNCCNEIGTVIEDFDNIKIPDKKHVVDSGYNHIKGELISPTLVNIAKGHQNTSMKDDDYKERFSGIREINYSEGYEGYSHNKSHTQPQHLQHIENIQVPTQITQSSKFNRIPMEFVSPNEPGWVNTSCGYNPKQIKESNLPSNIAAGNCERDEAMKMYNKNLFTQTIQPDVYTVSEVIEPINANMGISFTQQFEPVSSYIDENEHITYTEHDPRLYKKPEMVYDSSVTEDNVYDPRFSGYGTSYRAYTDHNVGQTRFYYDDINSVKMPNYIVRSNIDHLKDADSYGTLSDSNMFGNENTNNIRAIAQDSFLQASLEHRNDMMERLMRKRNGEMWQLRKYPKITSQRGSGGHHC